MNRIPLVIIAAIIALSAITQGAETPEMNKPDVIYQPGHGLERAMTLFAQSTPEHRSTVRLLFYGQSGVESPWWPIVVDDLKRRFPSVNLVMENRALGGFASQMLVNTSEGDLYPFQPDIMIFNVAGADQTYEDIIRRTSERTVCDILILNDYVRKDAEMTEQTDPAKIVRGGPMWGEYMNFIFMPRMARQYGTALVPIRQLWKQYVTENKVPLLDLLGPDKGHLNEAGCALMAKFVNAHLVAPAPGSLDPLQCDRVKTLSLGKDINWKDGKLALPFDGNRIDLIYNATGGPATPILIDGKKPSLHTNLYRYTRGITPKGQKFPVIMKIGRDALPVLEDWTLEAKLDPAKEGQYTFSLSGSVTGPDGQGRTDEKFVSNSKRIVINPDDWSYKFVFSMLTIHTGGQAVHAASAPSSPLPDTFVVKWHVEPLFFDEVKAPEQVQPGCERVITAVQGLVNGPHQLELSGGPDNGIAAIRIYHPRRPATD